MLIPQHSATFDRRATFPGTTRRLELARRLIGHGMRALLSVFALLLIGVSAHAQIYHGNDTTTRSVGNEPEAYQTATDSCARGGYRVTRVRGPYGNEIAVNCPSAAPPALRSASAQPGQPATHPITEPSAQMPQGETEPPARPEQDSTVTWNTYAQPW